LNSKRNGMIIFIAAIALTLIAVAVACYRAPQQARSVEAGHSNGKTVAVIYLTGEIGFGSSSLNGSTTDQAMQDLIRATNDPGLKAVVLRIDSPGGSPAASQELNDQVQRLKDSGKKVVVSCGDLAASGGYYVAVAADKIVADPATLTGSIGVISTVPNLQDLLARSATRSRSSRAALTRICSRQTARSPLKRRRSCRESSTTPTDSSCRL